tara:strand:- start:942 stop:1076 length:135 start_codon:yes stop_codon:yes gene_type:complete
MEKDQYQQLIHQLAMAEFDLKRAKQWREEIINKLKEEEPHAKSA